MDSPRISNELLEKLQTRAQEEGISLDDLVTRFLDTPPNYQHNLKAVIENFDGSVWSVDTRYCLLVSNRIFQRNMLQRLGRELKIGESPLHESLSPEMLADWRSYYDRALAGERFTLELSNLFSDMPREL